MNLVIVEDSELIRAQLERLIGLQPRIRIVGTAAEESQAVELILARRPDAVILDLALAPGSGVRVLERIRAAGCGARVLVLTNNADAALRQACGTLGVSGFFDKSREAQQCLDRLFSWLPPLPANETERLRALQTTALLDTPEHEVFDSITRLARSITGAPISLISLVDNDRQWFLSHDGIAQRETSRSIAFCAHAIAGDALLEIPDALADSRFRDNPLVTGEPHIRFYAGVPLVLSAGEAIGTLCVADTQPLRLTDAQRSALKTLARSALAEIELRRRVVHLEEEISLRQAAEAHILHLATRDPLTALPNRTTFRDRLMHQVRLAQRHRTGLAVMFIDLDRFKIINDTLGHEIGDSTLIIAADRLTRTLRDSDTVARLGGDEFAVILTDLNDSAEAVPLAEKLIRELAAAFMVKSHRLRIDASVGIAVFPDHGESADELIRRADLAMYQAKRLGGGRAVVFDRQLDERAEAALALENDLRDAIESDQLVLLYQPQVTLAGGVLSGLEALVRWEHPHLGLLGPDSFITLAEERGLIQAIGEAVLDKALAQLAAWDAAGIDVPRIAVNVSPLELRMGYVERVNAALAANGIAPTRLELEITETALTADGIETLRILDALRARGISIAVDDFGVGYSSLGQLRRLPIDALKIDRSFIAEVHANPQDAAIARAVVTMAQALGLRTVAEGMESEPQLLAVERLACDCVQGYFISRPMPAGQAEIWLRRFEAAEESAGLADAAADASGAVPPLPIFA
jgi:diguanylate cyclase (GGDEF)-like protein